MRCVHLRVTRRANLVARSANALQSLGNRFRRLQLDNHVDATDINPEFQRAGANQRWQPAMFQVILDLPTHRIRYAAVMRQERAAGYPRPALTGTHCRSFVRT